MTTISQKSLKKLWKNRKRAFSSQLRHNLTDNILS